MLKIICRKGFKMEKKIKGIIPNTYEVISERFSKDLNSAVMELRHKKTGAKVALISNDDDNKVFSIAFRTPVENSTGVPHILEHSVLCGSKNFPIKDPFVELAKGSLNTFLNAMTFPDKTVYPVASCNDKDFQNLMHVYLDAVFHPNIYVHPEIFKQEGWHYQLADKDADLEISGVVYSEMKGVFSSPDDVMDRQIMNALFPDVTYGVESGGDPDFIPTLSYEQFLDFHQKYYHPTNSYIYLYGDMDMGEKLDFIDKEYLSAYTNQPVDSEIHLQSAFSETKDIEVFLPAMEEEEDEEKEDGDGTYLTYNTVVGENLDKELYLSLKILDYAICSAPGAPLKQALIDKGIGKDVFSSYENGIRQMYFNFVAKDASIEKKDEFLSTIREVLSDIVKNGFNDKAIRAAISRMEFQYREADYGSYPKGLVYNFLMLDSWIYDETKPFLHVEADDTFESLKKKVGTGYFEGLVEKYFLDNPHSAVVTGIPKPGMALQREEALKEKLSAYKSSLTEEQIEDLVRQTADLEKYQEEEDSEEALATIPLLKREDLRKEIIPFKAELSEYGGYKVLYHDIFTSGIAYIILSFDAEKLPIGLYPYFSLLKSCMGLMDTASYSYGDLHIETDLYTGMISPETATYVRLDSLQPGISMDVKVKTLKENVPKAFELTKEILFTTKLDDEKRLHELIREFRSRAESAMMSTGHVVAINRLSSYVTKGGFMKEKLSGIEYLRFIQDADDHFDDRKEDLIRGMKEASEIVLRPENVMLDIILPKDAGFGIEEEFVKLMKDAYTGELPATEDEDIIPVKKNEGFITPGDVQYVCRGGHTDVTKTPFNGAMCVLRTILGYDYLWNNVRVKGNAYGCVSSFTRTGNCAFVSYRDPNLSQTIDIFDKIPEYIRTFNGDDNRMTKYIIGTLSDIDTPFSPSALGHRSFTAYKIGLTNEALQKERDEILNATAENIRSLAPYIEEALSGNNLCVVGSQAAVTRDKDVFMHVEKLI